MADAIDPTIVERPIDTALTAVETALQTAINSWHRSSA